MESYINDIDPSYAVETIEVGQIPNHKWLLRRNDCASLHECLSRLGAGTYSLSTARGNFSLNSV